MVSNANAETIINMWYNEFKLVHKIASIGGRSRISKRPSYNQMYTIYRIAVHNSGCHKSTICMTLHPTPLQIDSEVSIAEAETTLVGVD